MSYINGIDGLRAVSVSLVLLFHAFPALVPGGFIGVDVFFVISGFLITRLIIQEIEAGTFTLGGFYVRRARRLLPSLTVVILATFVGAALILDPRAFGEFGDSLLATAAFVSNFFFYETTDYFSGPAHTKPLLHTWSLAVEEQFYLVAPIFLVVLWRWLGAQRILLIALAIALTSLVHSEWAANTNERYAFFMITSRAWELQIGAILALAARLGFAPSALVAELAGILGLAAILTSAFWLSSDSVFPGIRAVPLALGSAGVIAACLHSTTLVTRLLALSPVRHIGRISYALYLWHWPILALAHGKLERPLVAAEAGSLLLVSLILADLTWRYVEQPIRHGGLATLERGSALRKLLPYGGVLAGLLLLGFAIRIGDGWTWRLEPAAERVWRQIASTNELRDRCDGTENIFRNDLICNVGAPSKEPGKFDVILIGDSNADHWAPAMALYAREHAMAARQVTRNSCSALFGQNRIEPSANSRRRCRAYQEAVLDFIRRHPEIKTVMLSLKWPRFVGQSEDNGMQLDGDSRTRPPQGDLALYLDRTLAILGRRGIRVIVIGPVPYPSSLMTRCVIAALRSGRDGSDCRFPRKTENSRTEDIDNVIKRTVARHPHAHAILPADRLCNDQGCQLALAGTYLFKDPGHLNADGARELYRALAPWPVVRP